MTVRKKINVSRAMASVGCLLLLATAPSALSTEWDSLDPYEPSSKHPFGKPNPNAPDQLEQYSFMIGEWRCADRARQQDGSWKDSVSILRARYFLNGHGILNHTFLPESASAMTYQYDTDASVWRIANSQAPGYRNSDWLGEKDGATMVATRQPAAQPGNPMTMRIRFLNIEDQSFDWALEMETENGPLVVREKACTRTAG